MHAALDAGGDDGRLTRLDFVGLAVRRNHERPTQGCSSAAGLVTCYATWAPTNARDAVRWLEKN
jgi:hypothetical protein